MEELGLPELTVEQIEEFCLTAENAARRLILTRFSSKMVEKLNVSVEADGTKPVNLTVEIDLVMSTQIKNVDLGKLVDEASKEAFRASKNYLRRLT